MKITRKQQCRHVLCKNIPKQYTIKKRNSGMMVCKLEWKASQFPYKLKMSRHDQIIFRLQTPLARTKYQ